MGKLMFEQIVQYGFAGLAAAQLLILVWLVRRLLLTLEGNSRVIAGNLHALREQGERQKELAGACQLLRERLLIRPCLCENP